MNDERSAAETPALQERAGALQRLQDTLVANGAHQLDAVGWHYIGRLAERARSTRHGKVQDLLHDKLEKALQAFASRTAEAPGAPAGPVPEPLPSPLARLLQEMGPMETEVAGHSALPGAQAAWRAGSPRVQQFRKQLRKISVRKQVRNAMAQAPQNAGPINSHMLVLRALGLMRDISPDYLDRFMVHVDSLLRLEDMHRTPAPARKTAAARSAKK